MSAKMQRRRQARIVETLRDDIDRHFPPLGPCGICCDTVLGQRHRTIDAIAELVRAGEPIEQVAQDYRVTVEGIAIALAVSW